MLGCCKAHAGPFQVRREASKGRRKEVIAFIHDRKLIGYEVLRAR